jgi:hypothetical protein
LTKKRLSTESLSDIYKFFFSKKVSNYRVTLTLTGPGSGLIYMEAGPPINDGALFLIEVNTPK